MALTKDHIRCAAEACGFTVTGFEPGPGTRADISLRDEGSGQSITIGLWPDSTEADLARTLSMAATELRGCTVPMVSPDAWLA